MENLLVFGYGFSLILIGLFAKISYAKGILITIGLISELIAVISEIVENKRSK